MMVNSDDLLVETQFEDEDQKRLANEIIDLLSSNGLSCFEAADLILLIHREIKHLQFISPLKRG
jgi:hypothetical protein